MNVHKEYVNGVLISHTINGRRVFGPTISGNALGAAARVATAAVTGQRVTVSDEERDRRLAICYGCDLYVNKRCVKCGCVARWKARLATEHCPISKW